jgi:hypothetical protein
VLLAITCKLPKLEPSFISRKLKPPLESLRVLTHPLMVNFLPIDSAFLADATHSIAIVYSPIKAEI